MLYDLAIPHRIQHHILLLLPQGGAKGDAVDAPAVLVAAVGGLLAPLGQRLHPAHPPLVRTEGQQTLSARKRPQKYIFF